MVKFKTAVYLYFYQTVFIYESVEYVIEKSIQYQTNSAHSEAIRTIWPQFESHYGCLIKDVMSW